MAMYVGGEGLALLLYEKHGPPILAVILLAAAAFFLVLFVPDLRDAVELQQKHAQTIAKVIESRVDKGGWPGSATYELRYMFQLQAHGQPYERIERGSLGRNVIYTCRPEPQWLQAVQTGRVDVIYYPPDPHLNVALNDFPTNLRDAWLGISFSALFFAFSPAVIPMGRRMQRKRGNVAK